MYLNRSEVDVQNEHKPQTQSTAGFLAGRYEVSEGTAKML